MLRIAKFVVLLLWPPLKYLSPMKLIKKHPPVSFVIGFSRAEIFRVHPMFFLGSLDLGPGTLQETVQRLRILLDLINIPQRVL